jgi:hypothetical protein
MRGSRLLLVLVVGLLAACGDATGPETPSTAHQAGRTVVVDSVRMALMGDPAAAQQSGVFRFRIVGTPPVVAGDVIVGVQAGGFLRRVTGVARYGDVIELNTVQADLGEAIGTGSFDQSITIPFDSRPAVQTSVARYTLGPAQVNGLARGVTLGETGLNLSNLVIVDQPACAPGQTQNCPRLKVGIQSGGISLRSTLNMGASLSLTGISSAYISLDGTAAFGMDGFAEIGAGTRNASWSRSLGSVSRTFVTTAGPIPIAGKVTTELIARVTMDVNTATRLNAGFNSSATASIGAQWSRSAGFQKILSISAQATPLPVRVTNYPQITFKVIIEPKVTVSVLGIPGDSYTGLEPYLTAQVRADPSRRVTPYSLGWGVDGEVGVDFRIFSKSLGNWNYTAHLYDRTLTTG